MTKNCPHCKTIKSTEHFSKDKNRPGGLSSWCRQCVSTDSKKRYKADPQKNLAASKQWRQENPLNKIIYELRTRYGLTLDEFNSMRAIQNNCCAVCLIAENELSSRLHVDHCHNTNKVRGLLCSNCNTALGLLKENEKIILALLKYLKKANTTELADNTNEKVG